MTSSGSLYSGIGGLDLAAEWALGVTTRWQLDLVNANVRRRHFPHATQIEADVTTVDPNELPKVSVLVGGFACQDLSTAGKQAGLIAGARTGPTYRHLLRFAGARLTEKGFEVDQHRKWLPDQVVMENVSALLAKWREVMEDHWHRLGYSLTWIRARALDAGYPHRRARVFVIAERGGRSRGVLDAPRESAWTPERGERAWATVKSSDARSPGPMSGNGDRQGSDGLAVQVRPWATLTVNESGTGKRGPGAGRGSCPGDESITGQVRPWPTPQEADGLRGSATMMRGESNPTLTGAVRPWPTVVVRDHKTGELPDRVGTEALSCAAGAATLHLFGRRLNPDWTEALMGYPPGWTLPDGPQLHADPHAPAVRGRYPETWDRTQPWPGFDWEPSRTIPDGPPCPGRPGRIRGAGNAVQPQHGALAIETALRPAIYQPSLFATRTDPRD